MNPHGGRRSMSDSVDGAARHTRWRRATCLVPLLVMAIGAGGPADAQEPQRGDTVRDRVRLDYDAIGLRGGGFLFFPVIDAAFAWDDNIYREARDEDGDFITSVRPELTAVSQWSNHEIRLDAGIAADHFADHDAENTRDWFATAAARFDATRDAWIGVNLGVEVAHEDRGDPNAVSTTLDGPVSFTRRDVGLSAFYRLNRLDLTAEGSAASLSWDDATTSPDASFRQSDRDRGEITLAVRAGYDIVPEYEAFLRVTRNERTYDRPQGDIGILRDSRGWEIVAGTALDLGGIVFGDVFAGWITQDYDASELPTIDAVALGGSVDWNVTPLTTVNGSLERNVGESTLDASGFLSTEARVGVDHELLRNLILSAEVAFIDNDYEGISGEDGRDDEVVEVDARATWLLNRRLHVELSHRFRTRDSSVSGAGYDSRATSLTLRLQY